MPLQSARARPPLFRALGKEDPPKEITLDGESFTRIEIYKHDSWAATALYAGGNSRIVVKFNRIQPICGFPAAWIGRQLAVREQRALLRLAGTPQVPWALGSVSSEGRLLPNAVARSFIPGHPLRRGERLSHDFFDTIRALLFKMHSLGIAYVDLHKRENIIVGDDGKPYLVDFQIFFDLLNKRLCWIPGYHMVFKWLCQGDLYHLNKHVRKSAPFHPDAEYIGIPLWLRVHRLFAVPFRSFRRRFLVLKGIRLGRGSVTTEVFAEDAVRQEITERARELRKT